MIQGQQSPMQYQTIECGEFPVAAKVARFQGASGVEEAHLMLHPTAYADLAIQAGWLREAYQAACATLSMPMETGVFRRVFCSDLPNQANDLAAHLGAWEEDCAVSWVSQPPLPPAKLALWAYHVQSPEGPLEKRKDGATLTLQRGDLAHCWTTGLTCPEADTSYQQTAAIFAAYEEDLQAQGLHFADHVQRTWLFVQNVDANYQGLVAARREFFAAHGLTADTHYIASTGIEGRAAAVSARVLLDAYAIAGVRPQQVRYLLAPDNLCPTHHYGVTFERGVAIGYQDRTHVLISGTASIDNRGQILHPGQVLRQLDRTLENSAALLQEAGATFDDVCHYIVYVRDPSDVEVVHAAMTAHAGHTPWQVVVAPVCRPGWLVEIECMAIVPADAPTLPPFDPVAQAFLPAYQ